MTSTAALGLILAMRSPLKTEVLRSSDTKSGLDGCVQQLTFLPEQLRLGTIKVRDVLGNDLPITDKEIEDSLWHYYYDIDKTVNYLISQDSYLSLHSPGVETA